MARDGSEANAGLKYGADLVVDILRSEGVTHIFGNPGSTELEFIDAIENAGDIRYILGLHESCVIPMADGYASATGRPAFVNVHTMSGLGNALGALTNSMAIGTPMVVTAGQQHQAFLKNDPLLAFDLPRFAEPVCKWSAQVQSVDDLGTMLRRAFQDAMTPPTGPVFLSLPISVMGAVASQPLPPKSHIDRSTVAGGLNDLADLLLGVEPGRLALVLGREVAHRDASGGTNGDAIDAVRTLARTLGAAVFATPIVPVGVYPPADPMWQGHLPHTAVAISKILAPFERVLFLGGQPFQQSIYSEGSALPAGTELLHLSPDGHQPGRSYPVAFGATGNLRASLEALLPLLKERAKDRIDAQRVQNIVGERAVARAAAIRDLQQSARDQYGAAPMAALAAVHAALGAAPADAIVVDEGVSNGAHIRNLHLWEEPGRLVSCKQIIGWGLPAAIGVSLGHHAACPVLCIASDGGATFGMQALWTAAHANLPIVFAVLVNREYGMLRKMTQMIRPDSPKRWEQAFDLSQPPIDYVGIARSMGVDGVSVNHTDEIHGVVQAAFAAGKPYLVEIPIART